MKKQEIKEYFEKEALSQSFIKGILKGPHMVKILESNPLFFEEKEAMLYGNLVDDMFTYDITEFDEKYYIGGIQEKPSDIVVSIIREAFSNRLNDNIEDNNSFIIASALKHGYGKGKYTDEGIIKKIHEQKDYWDELIAINGKILISKTEYEIASAMANSIRSHVFTAYIFKNKCIYQTPLYFKYKDHQCKALCDIIYYDQDTHTIHVEDFKMTAYNTSFDIPYNKFKYYIQAEWYLIAVEENRKYIASLFNIKEDFNIGPFVFITESYLTPGRPLRYFMSEEQRERGREEIAKGIEMYNWHIKENIWDMTKNIYESKGFLEIA